MNYVGVGFSRDLFDFQGTRLTLNGTVGSTICGSMQLGDIPNEVRNPELIPNA